MVELQTLHGKDCAHIQYIHVHVVPSNDINAYYYSLASSFYNYSSAGIWASLLTVGICCKTYKNLNVQA